MEHLRCVVERITYQNADNGYTVLKCAVKNYSDLVTVVGTMPDTHVGSVLSLESIWNRKISWFRSGEGRWSKVCKKNCGKIREGYTGCY